MFNGTCSAIGQTDLKVYGSGTPINGNKVQIIGLLGFTNN
jgi:hypothetical protein